MSRFLVTLTLTHIFEGQNNGCDDSCHKHYYPQDTEEALALGEVDLCGKTKDGHAAT